MVASAKVSAGDGRNFVRREFVCRDRSCKCMTNWFLRDLDHAVLVTFSTAMPVAARRRF